MLLEVLVLFVIVALVNCKYQIKLRSKVNKDWMRSRKRFSESYSSDGTWLLQFKSQFKKKGWKEDVREILELSEDSLGVVIPEATYPVRTTFEKIKRLEKSRPGVIEHYEFFQPDWKTEIGTFDEGSKKEIVTPDEAFAFLRRHLIRGGKKSVSTRTTANTYFVHLVQDVHESDWLHQHVKERVSSTKFVVEFDDIESLAQHPSIFWIEFLPPVAMMSSGFGTQSRLSKLEHNRVIRNSNLLEKGISGRNQIVGIIDTGIDHDSCFYFDPDVELKPNEVNHAHRKIVQYLPVSIKEDDQIYTADFGDEEGGHGTHTSGSISGSVLETSPNFVSLLPYNGIAPDSKLVMQDVYNPDYPFLLIPNSLSESLFPLAKESGAHIHSNSWGCDFSGQIECEFDCFCVWAQGNQYQKPAGDRVTNSFCLNQWGRRCCEICSSYDSRAQDVDKYLHQNDDFVAVFAAGNFGAISMRSNVVTPSTSKNSIAVGASFGTNEEFVDSIQYTNWPLIFQVIKQYLGYDFQSTQQCCNFSGENSERIHQLCCPEKIQQKYLLNDDLFNENQLAQFSSRGPISQDGRFGIDVVAPGQPVISMYSDGNLDSFQCGLNPIPQAGASLMNSQGTSQATPQIAGLAALVREYFVEGFYPSGMKNVSDKISDVSGSLIKAVIIHSAQPLTGIVVLDKKYKLPQNYPNSLTGFGKPKLETALKFTDSPFNLWIENRREIEEGERLVYCFSTDGTDEDMDETFRATLVWYDEAGNPASSVSLVNDLELNLWSILNNKSTYHPGNNNPWHDTVNSVEQVRIQQQADEIIVVVEGISLRSESKKQVFSLVMTSGKSIIMTEGCVAPPRPMMKNSYWVLLQVTAVFLAGILFVATVIVISTVLVYMWFKKKKNARPPLAPIELHSDNSNHDDGVYYA